MTEKQAYDRLISEIINQSNDNIKKPHIPAEDKIMDAHKFLIAATEDKDKLIEIGLNPIYIDTLKDRIGAYSIANANYIVLKNNSGGLKDEFKKLEDEAHALRRQILCSYNFALEKNADAMEAIAEITNGRSRNDLIYDFVPMKTIAETYPEELTAIKFDFTQIDRAEELHSQMQELLSKIRTTPKEISEVKLIKDKAYTYLEEAVSNVKKYGQYLFRDDETRLSLYKNSFPKKHHKKQKEEESPIIAD